MRLVSFSSKTAPDAPIRIGAFIDGDTRIVDFTGTAPSRAAFQSMIGLMQAGDAAFDEARSMIEDGKAGHAEVLKTADIVLEAPVPVPESVRDWACFPEHHLAGVRTHHLRLAAQTDDPEAAMEQFRREGKLDLPPDYYELPRYHTCSRFNVIGPDQDAQWPHYGEQMDFELEFGFFIGKKGRDIPMAEASSYIFGFTIFNDLSLRDFQRKEGRIGGKCKEFDAANAMGPCLVTRDELADPYNLRMIARVNGEVWADNNSSTIGRSFEQVVSHMSDSTTIYPGEFHGSGTVGGGCGLEHDRYLNDGDVVELEVEGIGVLRNRVVRTKGKVLR